MVVGVCTLDLHLPGVDSLKGKRQILLSLKERIQRKFNVSIAEVDGQDLWQRAVLGVVSVGVVAVAGLAAAVRCAACFAVNGGINGARI